MKYAQSESVATAFVSIGLNYLNWDTATADEAHVLEDFIAEVDIVGVPHQQQEKHIWVNILFSSPQHATGTLSPVLLEVTAAKGLKNEVITRRDSTKLNQKALTQFLLDTRYFLKLFGLEFSPEVRSTKDRTVVFTPHEKILHIEDQKSTQKTIPLAEDEQQEQIEFILNYLGLTKRPPIFQQIRQWFKRWLRVRS